MSRRLAVLLALALPAVSASAVPLVFSHHGRLLDSADAPITGEVDFTIRIHRKDVDPQNEANLVWEHTYENVKVTAGVYAITVGPLTATDWDGVEPRWMGVKVNGGAELTPRLQIGSAPFAILAASAGNALKLNGKDESAFAAATHTHAASEVTGVAAAAVAAMGAKSNDNPLNHDRYTDAEAVSAVSATGTYVSKAEIGTTGIGIVDWTRLKNVPAGFADGTDDGNSYSAAASGGLTLGSDGAFGITSGGVTSGMLANDATSFAKVTGGGLSLLNGNLGIGTASPSGRLQVETATSGFVKDNPPSGAFGNFGLTGFNAANIANGVLGDSAWHTDAANNTAYLKIDLGSGTTKDYVRARIYSTGAYNGTWDFEYSDNDSSWTVVAASIRPATKGWHERTWPNAGAHRYWRLRLMNTPGGGAWLGELELYRPAPGPVFSVGNAGAIRRIQRTVGYGEFGDDSLDPVPGRVLNLQKERADTSLRVTYFDAHRVIAAGNMCQWEIQFDGKSCTDPGMVADTVYSDNASVNIHRGTTTLGYCRANADGVFAAGTHTIKVVLRGQNIVNTNDGSTNNYPTIGDCYTGWPAWSGRQFVLEAEEVY